MKSESSEFASQNSANISAGQTTMLFGIINLLIEKELITDGEVESVLSDLLVAHQVNKAANLSAAPIRHLMSMLASRKKYPF